MLKITQSPSATKGCTHLGLGSTTNWQRTSIGVLKVLTFASLMLTVRVADASAASWAEARAHNKGCSGNVQVWHVRCEKRGGAWSHACRNPTFKRFRGAPVSDSLVRLIRHGPRFTPKPHVVVPFGTSVVPTTKVVVRGRLSECGTSAVSETVRRPRGARGRRFRLSRGAG